MGLIIICKPVVNSKRSLIVRVRLTLTHKALHTRLEALASLICKCRRSNEVKNTHYDPYSCSQFSNQQCPCDLRPTRLFKAILWRVVSLFSSLWPNSITHSLQTKAFRWLERERKPFVASLPSSTFFNAQVFIQVHF